MPIRTGAQYIENLKQSMPETWIGNERVQDVTTHPALAPAVRAVARLYDLQHDPQLQEFMTYRSPSTGDLVGTSFLIPKSRDDLVKRRLMHKTWADETFGIMGRTTDFISAMLTAWAIRADFFGEYADNVRRYYEFIREHDLFLTHVLINPQVDRSKSPAEQPDPFTYVGVVRETDKGLIVRGAKMLATAGPYADEMLVWPFGRHTPKDARYAIAFAVPMSAPGVRLICREPYTKQSVYDHPLASQFDEMDAIVVFDDVLVPWERVFINQDPERVNNIWQVNSNAFTGHQTSIRLLSKLQFMLGLTLLCADAIQISQFPNVQDMIGEITTYIELVRAGIIASEATAEVLPDGTYVPNVTPLLAIRNSGNRWYPRVREIMQLLLAGGLMYQPASVTVFDSPIADDVRKYYRGASISAEEKIKLFKAAADLAVSDFGGRHELYERFYAGDPFYLRIITQYRLYDKTEALNLAKKLLESYDVADTLDALKRAEEELVKEQPAGR